MERRGWGTQGSRSPQIGLGCMGIAGSTVLMSATSRNPSPPSIGRSSWESTSGHGGRLRAVHQRAARGTRDQDRRDRVWWRQVRQSPRRRRKLGRHQTPDCVRQACDASLKRLGVGTRLYYQHRVDKQVPIEHSRRVGWCVTAGATPGTLRQRRRPFVVRIACVPLPALRPRIQHSGLATWKGSWRPCASGHRLRRL